MAPCSCATRAAAVNGGVDGPTCYANAQHWWRACLYVEMPQTQIYVVSVCAP